MKRISSRLLLAGFVLSLSGLNTVFADAQKYITEHPLAVADLVQSTVQGTTDVHPVEIFLSSSKVFSVATAPDREAIEDLMGTEPLSTSHLIEVLDINSPTRSGGPQAGTEPRTGHKTFVIRRPIPGVGNFPEEKKVAISRGSNAAIAKIGDSIEWVHSYLTAEGTYCIYRAVDEATIREHGKLAGAPILDIYEVN